MASVTDPSSSPPPAAPSREPPADWPVFAITAATVLGELGREAHERAAVPAGDEALDEPAGHELQAARLEA